MNPVKTTDKNKLALIEKIRNAGEIKLGWDSMVISNEKGIHAIMIGTNEWIQIIRELAFGTKIEPDQLN